LHLKPAERKPAGFFVGDSAVKKLLSRWFVKASVAFSGKTEERLAREWVWYYFLYRSRIRAYWLAVAS